MPRGCSKLHGVPARSMAFQCAPWRFSALHGVPVRSMAFQCAPRRSSALHGVPARSMAFQCAPWRSNTLHGAPARSMTFQCAPWRSSALHDIPVHSMAFQRALHDVPARPFRPGSIPDMAGVIWSGSPCQLPGTPRKIAARVRNRRGLQSEQKYAASSGNRGGNIPREVAKNYGRRSEQLSSLFSTMEASEVTANEI